MIFDALILGEWLKTIVARLVSQDFYPRQGTSEIIKPTVQKCVQRVGHNLHRFSRNRRTAFLFWPMLSAQPRAISTNPNSEKVALGNIDVENHGKRMVSPAK